MRCLLLVRAEELTVSELTELLGVAQSTVSGMLRQLMGAELVSGRRDGRHVYYRATEGLPWVDEALAESRLSALDRAGLARVVAQRRQAQGADGGDALSGAFDRANVPGRSWKGLARSLLMLGEHGDVCDLGVGSGELTLLLARAARTLVAVDREPALLESLERRANAAGLQNLRVLATDFEALELQAPVDLMVISLSLHQAVDPTRVLEGACANLRPGGRIWVTELAAHDQEWVIDRLGHRWLGFEPDVLTAWLEQAGFVNIRLERGGRDRRAPRFESLICIGERP